MLRKRIVIIDMDEEFRLLVSSVLRLSDKFAVVGSYAEPQSAVRLLARDKPDIMVTDICFPATHPVEYIKAALERVHLINVLVVTDYDDSNQALELIANGVIGYILKKDILLRLHSALETVAQGGSPLDEKIARKLVSNLQISRSTPLTRQESIVLKLITEGKTYSMIAEELSISNDTSKTHIKNIYRKLNVNSKTEAVRKAISDRLVHIG